MGFDFAAVSERVIGDTLAQSRTFGYDSPAHNRGEIMPLHGPELSDDVYLPPHRVLERGLQRDPDGMAFGSLLTTKTWRNLEDAATRYARNLLALGLKPGDRVASLMPNRVALLVHYLGCLKARLVATPLNYRYMAPEIDHALEVSGASILLSHVERAEDLSKSKLAEKLPLGRISYAVEDDGNTQFSALLADPPAIELPEPQPDDAAFILFTSGSTGKPKGVTHTHRSFGHLVAAGVQTFKITPQDCFLPGSSCSHIGGIGFSFIAWAGGASVLSARTLQRRGDPAAAAPVPPDDHDHAARGALRAGARPRCAAGRFRFVPSGVLRRRQGFAGA